MATKPYRALDKLTPSFRTKVIKFLAECPQIFVTESWRSDERQAELYKAKLSQVTHSNHQDGKAIDIGFSIGTELYPVDLKKWQEVADVAKKYSIDWGYSLWHWDRPHFQDNGIPIIANITHPMTNKYADILNQYVKDGYKTVFSSFEGETPCSEAETKTLVDIGFARFEQRLKAK